MLRPSECDGVIVDHNAFYVVDMCVLRSKCGSYVFRTQRAVYNNQSGYTSGSDVPIPVFPAADGSTAPTASARLMTASAPDQLMTASASNQLMTAASTGTAAALFLMVSIVNRGVQQGGGTATDRYGDTILDLFWHYGTLLLQAGLDADSPGPLQVSAMGLEVVSLACLLAVLVNESDVEFENEADEDSCPVDLFEIINDEDEMSKLSARELQRLTTCLTLEEDDMAAPNGVVKEEKRMLEQSENGCSAAVAE